MSYKCFCGTWAVERTAQTEANGGKKFLGCSHGSQGCGFFRWVDGCLRFKVLQIEVEKMKFQARRWKLGCLFLVVLFLFFFVWNVLSVEDVKEDL